MIDEISNINDKDPVRLYNTCISFSRFLFSRWWSQCTLLFLGWSLSWSSMRPPQSGQRTAQALLMWVEIVFSSFVYLHSASKWISGNTEVHLVSWTWDLWAGDFWQAEGVEGDVRREDQEEQDNQLWVEVSTCCYKRIRENVNWIPTLLICLCHPLYSRWRSTQWKNNENSKNMELNNRDVQRLKIVRPLVRKPIKQDVE